MLKAIIDWFFPWEYYTLKTNPGFMGGHYNGFRRHKKFGYWEGLYISPAIDYELWTDIDDENLLTALEEARNDAL